VNARSESGEQRDPKDSHESASGQIQNFNTGITTPYEAPEETRCRIPPDKASAAECVAHIIDYFKVAPHRAGLHDFELSETHLR